MPANSLRQQFLIQYTQSWGTKSNCATKIATFFSLIHMANDDTKTTNPFAALNFHHIYLWCQCQSSLHDVLLNLPQIFKNKNTHTHWFNNIYLIKKIIVNEKLFDAQCPINKSLESYFLILWFNKISQTPSSALPPTTDDRMTSYSTKHSLTTTVLHNNNK